MGKRWGREGEGGRDRGWKDGEITICKFAIITQKGRYAKSRQFNTLV
jgi:hypothetical protein